MAYKFVMNLNKKKNILIITCYIVTCYFLYQLYFFFTISSAANDHNIVPILDHDIIKDTQYFRSDVDEYISDHGKIRGVYYTDIESYRPDSKNEFKCKSSDQKIPFDQVNDNYCDCDDNTDEPSTSACPNGVFYCDTQQPRRHILKIPSSKVNDGICDCCDGSDEWHNKNEDFLSQNTMLQFRFYVPECPNTCN